MNPTTKKILLTIAAVPATFVVLVVWGFIIGLIGTLAGYRDTAGTQWFSIFSNVIGLAAFIVMVWLIWRKH